MFLTSWTRCDSTGPVVCQKHPCTCCSALLITIVSGGVGQSPKQIARMCATAAGAERHAVHHQGL